MTQTLMTLTPGPGLQTPWEREREIGPSGDSDNLESKFPVTCPNCRLEGRQPVRPDCPVSHGKPAIRVGKCHVPVSKCWQPTPFFIQTLLPPTVWAIWDPLFKPGPALGWPILTFGINGSFFYLFLSQTIWNVCSKIIVWFWYTRVWVVLCLKLVPRILSKFLCSLRVYVVRLSSSPPNGCALCKSTPFPGHLDFKKIFFK